MSALHPIMRQAQRILNDAGNDITRPFKAILDRYYLSAIEYRYWDDLRIEPTARNSGTKAPAFALWKNGIYLYDFDNAVLASEKEIFFTVQMPHGWKEGTTVEPHVHWLNKTAGTAGHVVRWGLEYSMTDIGSVFPASTTIYGTTIEGGGVITAADSHMVTDFSGIDMTGKKISTIIACRLFRNSSHADDTFTGTASLLYIDWHIQMARPGSRWEYKT